MGSGSDVLVVTCRHQENPSCDDRKEKAIENNCDENHGGTCVDDSQVISNIDLCDPADLVSSPHH